MSIIIIIIILMQGLLRVDQGGSGSTRRPTRKRDRSILCIPQISVMPFSLRVKDFCCCFAADTPPFLRQACAVMPLHVYFKCRSQ